MRYAGNEGFTADFSKVSATFESDGVLVIVFDNGQTVHFNLTAQQTLDIIKSHKEYLIALEKKMYIHKNTYEVLEDVISEGINWLEIPDGSVVAYYFDGNDPDGDDEVVFYNHLGEIYDKCWHEIDKNSLAYRDKWAKKVWEKDDETVVSGETVIDDERSSLYKNLISGVSKIKIGGDGGIISPSCCSNENKPIKSDGGSSDYYKREIPLVMLQRWKKEGVIEAKDVMKLFLGNDYNFCNSFKAHCRVQSLREGFGKEGADEKYDLRKAWFFCEDSYNDFLERVEGDA